MPSLSCPLSSLSGPYPVPGVQWGLALGVGFPGPCGNLPWDLMSRVQFHRSGKAEGKSTLVPFLLYLRK